jgi:choloylglycine hydrolase
MKPSRLVRSVVAGLFVGQLMLGIPAANACTGIRIKPKDGSVIFARTLEFAADMHSDIIVIPRNKQFVGTAPQDRAGLHWTTKYATVGTNAFGMPVVLDALNEKGLAVGLFYFPDYAQYQEIGPQDVAKSLAPWELGAFLLGTCADVQEAVEAVKQVRVGAAVQKDMGFVPPCHYIVNDAQGGCVVLEYVGGKLQIYDNPLGVFSNAPTFDWHLTNLQNYVKLSVNNAPAVNLAGIKLSGFGQGSGMLGLPGDFTPPSRFVRAVAFSQPALPVETARDGVLQVFHLLNQFDIPKGAARAVENGREVVDYTQWTGASDLANLRYYFHTYDDRRIRVVDLKTMNLDASDIKTIRMNGSEIIDDVSMRAK